MRIAVFSTKKYDKEYLDKSNSKSGNDLVYFESHLNNTTCKLAFGFEAVCVFVHDELDAKVLKLLSLNGTKLVVLRCAGFNNVDLKAAKILGINVMRVPAYSLHGIAEHTVALMLALNRKLTRAYQRVRDGNFSLEGLLGFEMQGKTVGILGTGKIGTCVARILKGFGCHLLGFDPYPNSECRDFGVKYMDLQEVITGSEIITLHLPLSESTHHIINKELIGKMKDNVMLINTSRGGLIDTDEVIRALKSGRIGYLGLDVYEEEDNVFYEDMSGRVLQDDTLARLLTFPNVIMTSHQAFFTDTALRNISEKTLQNIEDYKNGKIEESNALL